MPARSGSSPIGAHFHVAHGLSNAMLFPAVTAFSLANNPVVPTTEEIQDLYNQIYA